MAESGETSKIIGIYNSDCSCRRAVFLIPGDRIPLCPECGGSVSWKPVWAIALGRTGTRQSSSVPCNEWDEC